jgi:hypothetical protein
MGVAGNLLEASQIHQGLLHLMKIAHLLGKSVLTQFAPLIEGD